MKYTDAMIVEKLRLYPMLQEKQKLLRFELSNVAHVSEDDVLASLAYGSPSCKDSSGGSVDNRDKTLKMALSYKDLAAELNYEAVLEIYQELNEVKAQIDRLEYYISLLSPEQEQVLRLCYFEKKTWYEIESESGVSRRTLTKRRTEAVARLVQMYNYTGEFLKK